MTAHTLTLSNGTKMIVISPIQDARKLMAELERDKGWEFNWSDLL